MRAPRNFPPRIGPERLLLLVALLVFLAGATCLAHRPSSEIADISRSWLGALPSMGLPLVHALLLR